MVSIAWSEAFSVGNPLLDSDHRILFDLLVQLFDATDTGQSRDVVGSVLSALSEYAEHHFRREEAMMAASGYPGLEAHKAEHRQLEAHVRDICGRYRAGERGAVDEQVVELLKKWLTQHIQVTDKSYRPWVERVVDGGAKPPSEKLGDGRQS
ncbi:hemerythrin-like protein [Paramagnetospirillum caucaseum]|uniref:Hemerythrin-like protein n=1 Tax=Paramagnetospirillum caucaseum TaxID=1244869 RepID=M2Z498_9PROT|nr:bacteriohemerythrin [Paramagnetospirillum caucaseum]EME69195.1 hemerythrin-like protein [Paramagnetospirillum caucaseum]